VSIQWSASGSGKERGMLMLAEKKKKKKKIVISAILRQFLYFYYPWQIFLLAVLLAVLGISIHNCYGKFFFSLLSGCSISWDWVLFHR
jgi:hypothetical protein